MVTKTTQQMLKDLRPLQANPLRAVQMTYEMLESLTNGEVRLVEASNPTAYSLEVSCVNTAGAIMQAEALSRRMYPEMAFTQEELYLHMADPDYYNRFSQPAESTFGIIYRLDELRAKAVDDGNGGRQLVIPKHTSISYAGYDFVLQYPIVIKVMYNDTVAVHMDMTERSLQYQPESNLISIIASSSENEVEYLLIEVPVQQIKLTTTVLPVTSFIGFSRSVTFSDMFYYARAYIFDEMRNSWYEINVTHNQQIYNPNKATVCLQVLNQSLNVYIPQIYFDNNLIFDTVRLDIYTTKGPLNVDLNKLIEHESSSKVSYGDSPYKGTTIYSAPLKSVSTAMIMPKANLTGGAGPLSFLDLQKRVVNRSQAWAGLPVTSNQATSTIIDAGFDLVTQLDNVTDRQYVATKQVPPPNDDSTVTGIGCCIQLVELALEELMDTTSMLSGRTRVTITPGTLFETIGGKISLIDNDTRDSMLLEAKTNPDSLANKVNSKQYYYTPYHYVLDTMNHLFKIRPYHLTSPKVLSRELIQQNSGLGLNLRSDKYSISYNPDGTGYTVLVSLELNSSLNVLPPDRISAQLSYLVSSTGTRRAHVKGVFVSPIDQATQKPVGNKWLYRFDILSDFDIDSKHKLDVNNTGYPIDLTQTFDLLIVAKDYRPNNAGVTDIDSIVSFAAIDGYDYNSTYLGATQEKVTFEFGHFLKHLWRRSRTIVGIAEYQRYTEDVQATYTENIYLRDSNGNLVIEVDYATSTPSLTILHAKGTPVFNTDGSPAILHHKGDLVVVNGEYVPIQNEYELKRQMDIFLVDGRYFFATNDDTNNYLKESIDLITKWIVKDIKHLQQRFLERTDLYYYPTSSVGIINVMIANGTILKTKADQPLNVTYYLRESQYTDSEVRQKLMESTAGVLSQTINSIKKVVGTALTKNDLIFALTNAFKADVVNVEMSGFMNDEYNAVLVTDVSALPAIGKKLETMTNFTLKVVDDIGYEFKVMKDKNLLLDKVNGPKE